MKKTILSLAMLLLASAGFAQCGKNAGYEVKAENAYTNYNVRYASNPRDAKNYDTKRLRGEFAIEFTRSFSFQRYFFLPQVLEDRLLW